MMELLWLLLPVAAASGWFAARRSAAPRDKLKVDPASDYFRGLNFLLNEQPDKAIDVFVKMLEVDSDTVETHLALGNLFRRRGEVDRAIRIHQNLIARPTLNRDQRALALLELGQDYMRAGLFDRAESLFHELGDLNLYQEQALSNLRIIYQQEKDWDKCLHVSKKLEQLTGKSLRIEQAHYYCELAEQARQKRDFATVSNLLKKAQACDSNCVRATLLQGELEASQGTCKSAIKIYKRVEEQDPDYISEMLPSLLHCYKETGNRKDLFSYLRDLLARHENIATALVVTDIIEAEQGEDQALEFLTGFLQNSPNLEGLDKLITLNLKSRQGATPETLRILKQLVEKMLSNTSAYQCVRCGYHAKTLHWQCPGCKSWSSIKPVEQLSEGHSLGVEGQGSLRQSM